MVKFTIRKADGGYLIGLGITEVNVGFLKLGRPIMLRLATLGLPPDADMSRSEVYLFYGATLEQIERTLRPFIGPETLVHDARKEPQ